MTTSPAIGISRAVTATLARDLCAALSRALRDPTESVLADQPEIHRLLAECPDPMRRAELERFVRGIDGLPADARHDFAIALHPVQVESKLWLIDELTRRADVVARPLVVLGAWYGILPLLLNWRLTPPPRHVVCVDIDPAACATGARTIGALYNTIEYRCADALGLDHGSSPGTPPSIIVNTICEHLDRPSEWWAGIPGGQLIAVQSNDYAACPDHVNCVEDVAGLVAQYPMSDLLFAGRLRLAAVDGLPGMTRFMAIGRR